MPTSRTTFRPGSIVLTGPADCPFCRIAQGEDADARVVYDGAQTIGFMPPEPATLGHVLVIPRDHIPDVWQLSIRTAEDLAHATLRVAVAIRNAMSPDGLNIIQSNGAAATQTVAHLHVHLLPRWFGDPVGEFWPDETNYPDALKADAFERVRDECQKAAGYDRRSP